MIDDPELPKVGLATQEGSDATWCVWAPKAECVELVLEAGGDARSFTMVRDQRGYHQSVTRKPALGQRYGFRLDGGPPLPDPCSRWQPEGINALSAVFDPTTFCWDDDEWIGIDRADLVFYELHVGTFTEEGTFDAVIPRINALRALGITAIELMPVGQFAGTRSWGYDGVHPFAPQNRYGGPHGLKRLVEACHRRGMAIFLDVVYNHFGPEGNVFPIFGDYLTEKYKTDWGPALNFDGRGCDAVRAMVLDNVRQWIRDYRFDGLRIDAADQIVDRSPRHILSEIVEVAHESAARLGRQAHVFAETDLNDAPRFLEPVHRGGFGLDGQWNDDFHHAAKVALTGETRGYYLDFSPGPVALCKSIERVFVNDGGYSAYRGRRHGAPVGELPGDRFVAFVQNHDQVGNGRGSERNATRLPRPAVRLAAGILLLSPRLPLLFMGEEYGETRPFPFFCDYSDPELIKAVRDGRKAEFSAFFHDAEVPDPVAPSTRDSAILGWNWDSPERAGLRRLYGELLSLRRTLAGLRENSRAVARLLGENLMEMRRGKGASELSIIFNLANAESLLPISTGETRVCFRSEAERFGGTFPDETGWTGYLLPFEFAIFERIGLD
ncbi:malto-oligosyltrehalose trehalohydrolase [Singulisphaera rosea]